VATLVTRRTLGVGILRIMQGYADAHIVEPTGHNDGPQIHRFQALLDLREGTVTEEGDPYCAAAVVYAACKELCYRHGLDTTPENLKAMLPELRAQHFVPSAYVPDIWADAIRRDTFIPVARRQMAQPGDLLLMEFRIPRRGRPQHVGVLKAEGTLRAATVEANTSPDNIGSQSEGQGIYAKLRWYNCILGFVALRG
jgi:hypothetical protein